MKRSMLVLSKFFVQVVSALHTLIRSKILFFKLPGLKFAFHRNKVRVCEQCFVLHHHSKESDNINTSLLSQEGEDDVDDALLTSRLRLSSRSSSTNGMPGNGEGSESTIGPLIGPGDLQPRSVEDGARAAKFVVGSASRYVWHSQYLLIILSET